MVGNQNGSQSYCTWEEIKNIQLIQKKNVVNFKKCVVHTQIDTVFRLYQMIVSEYVERHRALALALYQLRVWSKYCPRGESPCWCVTAAIPNCVGL